MYLPPTMVVPWERSLKVRERSCGGADMVQGLLTAVNPQLHHHHLKHEPEPNSPGFFSFSTSTFAGSSTFLSLQKEQCILTSHLFHKTADLSFAWSCKNLQVGPGPKPSLCSHCSPVSFAWLSHSHDLPAATEQYQRASWLLRTIL